MLITLELKQSFKKCTQQYLWKSLKTAERDTAEISIQEIKSNTSV